jgi:hypothetical protein
MAMLLLLLPAVTEPPLTTSMPSRAVMLAAVFAIEMLLLLLPTAVALVVAEMPIPPALIVPLFTRPRVPLAPLVAALMPKSLGAVMAPLFTRLRVPTPVTNA